MQSRGLKQSVGLQVQSTSESELEAEAKTAGKGRRAGQGSSDSGECWIKPQGYSYEVLSAGEPTIAHCMHSKCNTKHKSTKSVVTCRMFFLT